MDNTPTMNYGSHVRPDFKGMIHVMDMDEQHLPKHNKRLVFVGDVHGCRDELQRLRASRMSSQDVVVVPVRDVLS